MQGFLEIVISQVLNQKNVGEAFSFIIRGDQKNKKVDFELAMWLFPLNSLLVASI